MSEAFDPWLSDGDAGHLFPTHAALRFAMELKCPIDVKFTWIISGIGIIKEASSPTPVIAVFYRCFDPAR